MNHSKNIDLMLKLICESIEKTSNQQLKRFDLTLSQGRILGYLHERKGLKTSQKDIEEYFAVTHPTVIGILHRLESKGFITSEFDAEDKRIKNIYLTEKEAPIYLIMSEFRQQVEQKMLRKLTDAQIKELQYLLNIIYNSIQA
ncbi:MAG: hypothetical protein H6Q74_2550 [Firmicutes bacterium]|nr:hypothetical protein [Bacillota bacterium]